MNRWTDDELDASFEAFHVNAEVESLRALSRAYLTAIGLASIHWHEHDYKTLTLCFGCNAKPVCKDCCHEHFRRCL